MSSSLRRASPPWGLISQILASGTNFAVLIALARQEEVEDFGWSALTIAVVTAVVGVCRSVFGTAIALSSRADRSLTTEARRGTAVATLLVALFGLPAAVIFFLIGDVTAAMAFLVAPVVTFHDMLRQACFSVQRASSAAMGDAIRLAIGLLIIPLSGLLGIPGWMVVLSWGITAGIGGTLLAGCVGWTLPSLSDLMSASTYPRRSRLELFGDSLLIQFTPIVTGSIVGLSLGAIALSGFRGASTILGPMSIFFTAIPLLMLPKLAREQVSSPRHAMKTMAPISLALSAACMTIAALSLCIPQSLGIGLLGDSWKAAIPVLPLLALQFSLQPWSIQASTTLKLVGNTSALLRLRVVRSVFVVICVLLVAQRGTLLTVVIAIIFAEATMTVAYILTAQRHPADDNRDAIKPTNHIGQNRDGHGRPI